MKRTQLLLLSTGICCCVYFISCEKETIIGKNAIAVAGRDTVVSLPQDDGLVLDGSRSQFPDGDPGSYSWSKISGPGTVEINYRLSSKALVRYLSAGTYLFELRVADNQGTKSRDTIKVSVNTFPRGFEILLNDLTWQYYTDPDGFEESVFLQTAKRPDLFHPEQGMVNGSSLYPDVYLKPEPSSNWILIKSAEHFDLNMPDRFYYYSGFNAMNVVNYPMDRKWLGKKAAIRINF